jgi:hypothetical protein
VLLPTFSTPNYICTTNKRQDYILTPNPKLLEDVKYNSKHYGLKMKSINENNLPIKRNLKLVYILSLIIVSLLVIASICGILFGSVIYPTDELLSTFISNDVVNLLIGLPIIIGSIFLTLRGKLIGLLFWSGALFFVLYTYMIYVLAMPLNWAFLLHLTLTTLSVYTIIILVASIDGIKIQRRLTGVVYERIAGGF